MDKFEISLTATRVIFNKVFKKFEDLVNDIKLVEVKVNSALIVGHYKHPKTREFLGEKYEKKYSILVCDDILIEKRDGD